ncbi:MAG: hypothetical protein VB140_07055 [Burkholderia sp.]|nr:MAG: hypothetical protein E5299_01701 [Burkholderia gladioli]
MHLTRIRVEREMVSRVRTRPCEVLIIRTFSPIQKLFQRGDAWWGYVQENGEKIRPVVVNNDVNNVICMVGLRAWK